MNFKLQKPFEKRKEKRSKLTKDTGFKYDDRLHRYLLDGVELLSATTLISRYSKPFESIYISQMSANKNKREGKPLQEASLVRRYWSLLGSHASQLGSAGHDFCVMYWLDRNTKPVSVLDFNAKKAMDALMQRFEILNMEIPRGNKSYMIGYTIDVELQDKMSGEIVLGDFKFSKQFTSAQYKENKGRLPSRLLEPFEELRDVGHDKGLIQLNIYKKMYELDVSRGVSYCLLIHIDGFRKFYDKGYKAYKVTDLSEKVDKILKPHKDSNVVMDLM